MSRTLRYSLFLLLSISFINFLSNFLFNLIGRTYEFPPSGRLLMMIIASIISSAIVTFIVISTAPVLKNYLTTYRQLLRLDTLSHPLLLRLQKEAPSTFQHSLQVANLANKAAKVVGADSFLTRIGGYYHDIGKLNDPDFYLENRRQGQPKPDEHDIKKVVKRIQEHIKAGIKLARDNQLPNEVISFIPEHHGTLLVSYLYDKAKENNVKVNKKDFRYPGPKPLSKESAIIMLADAIESKLRTMANLDEISINNLVDEIITSRLEDKQLDLSGLTKTDIEKIKIAFVEGAQIVHHQRLSYPQR